jgi:hypothetical protein
MTLPPLGADHSGTGARASGAHGGGASSGEGDGQSGDRVPRARRAIALLPRALRPVGNGGRDAGDDGDRRADETALLPVAHGVPANPRRDARRPLRRCRAARAGGARAREAAAERVHDVRLPLCADARDPLGPGPEGCQYLVRHAAARWYSCRSPPSRSRRWIVACGGGGVGGWIAIGG